MLRKKQSLSSSSTGTPKSKRSRAVNAGIKLAVAIVACIGLAFGGCATVPKKVVRDTQTYTAEILAGLAREQAAAEALVVAAELARSAGDEELCREYYAPALLIEVKAEPQAYRALWLAGLPYPLADGSLPAPGTEQEDPGPAGKVEDQIVASWCIDPVLDPEADPEGLERVP